MRDTFNREIEYLRISVTELCNLRCAYCMSEEGVFKKQHDEMLRNEEIVDVVKCAAKLGIRKVRITGGEPLVKKGIIELCRDIKKIKGIDELCITTNGILLKEMARPLKEAGVNRINLSIDTMKEDRYKRITRSGELTSLAESCRELRKVEFDKIKINVVLIKGFNDDEIKDFVEITQNEDVEVRFIELMPIGENLNFDLGTYMPCEEVLKIVPELTTNENFSGVADLYSLPNAKGKVGLIKPISCEFCDTCNKIRITADGKIKPCLHMKKEYNIKGLNTKEIEEMLIKTIKEKPKRREKLGDGHKSRAGRYMNQIGG